MEKYLAKKHYPHLDGLRGVAIILVLLVHFYSIEIGWIGVDLFFVLSGFLITNILLNYESSVHSYKIFLIRRSLRIFPLYFFSLLLIFVIGVQLFFKYIPDFDVLSNNQIYFWTYTQNFFFVTDISKPSTLNHFWSLAIEEQFYIIWPTIVFKFKKNIRYLFSIFSILILISFLLKLTSNDIAVNYTLLPYRMDSLIFGGVISLLVKNNISIKPRFIISVISIALIAFLWVANLEGSLKHNSLWMSKIGYFVIDLFFACFLLCSLFMNDLGSKIRGLLSNQLLMKFGKYSYGLYIIHWPIKHLIRKSGTFDFVGSGLVINSIILIICIVSAYLLYHIFEVRFLNLKHKFEIAKR